MQINRTGNLAAAARLGASFVGLLLVTACTDVKDAYMVDSVIKPPNAELMQSTGLFGLTKAQYVPKPFDVYSEHFPGDTDDPTRKAYAFAKSTEPSPKGSSAAAPTQGGTPAGKPDPAVANRDALMLFLIQNSDDICHAHEAGIIADSSTANFGFSETATILSSLGAIVTGVTTVRALSGAAAAVNATRDNFNNVFYQNLLAAAIIKSIESSRTDKRGTLLQHTGKDEDYSTDRMLSDLVDYHESCSFYQGLVSLTSAAARVQSSADELAARAKALSAQIDANNATIKALGTNATGVAKLNDANAQLAAEIAQIQFQLSLVPSSNASPPATTAPATAPASTTGTTQK